MGQHECTPSRAFDPRLGEVLVFAVVARNGYARHDLPRIRHCGVGRVEYPAIVKRSFEHR